MKYALKILTALALLSSVAFAGEYKVKKNDSLWKISKAQYSLDKKQKVEIDKGWMAIAQVNNLKNASMIKAGQTLEIPDKSKIDALYKKYAKTHKRTVTTKKSVKIPKAPKGYVYVATVEDAHITGYCPKGCCCGKDANGKTSIGDNAWIMNGVAAAPKAMIALGINGISRKTRTKVYIPSFGWKEIDDTGGGMRLSWKNKRVVQLDVRHRSHGRAFKVNRKEDVHIFAKKKKSSDTAIAMVK